MTSLNQSRFKTFLFWLNHRVEQTGAQYLAFGIFGIINYPLSYFMWHDVINIYNPLSLRLIAALLCIPLLLHQYWPAKYQFYLPLYWCFTILYCIPFFETYILLMNWSDPWVINMVLALFLFILLVDWVVFILLLSIGVSVAFLLYSVFGDSTRAIQSQTAFLAAYMYTVAIMIGSIFSRNREKVSYEKIQAAKGIAYNIAHELRTPLSAIKAGVSGIDEYLQMLTNHHEQMIPVKKLSVLKKQMQYVETEVDLSNAVINMLLMNISKPHHIESKLQLCSIKQCIDTAIQRYPFGIVMADKVHWAGDQDFLFRGIALSIIHVLFNLFKNAIYYIKKAGKGDIKIWLSTQSRHHQLHFMDTGEGIDPVVLPHIFNQFYSKTSHGYGIGLSFCKRVMTEINGQILCRSVKGEYTEFVLKFPKNRDLTTGVLL